MALITQCSPCQMGDHRNHYHVVQAAPEGGVGGAVCVCKGECRDVSPEERFERLLGVRPDTLKRLFKSVRG